MALSGLDSVTVENGVATVASLAPGAWRLLQAPPFSGLRSILDPRRAGEARLLADISIAPGEVVEVALPDGRERVGE